MKRIVQFVFNNIFNNTRGVVFIVERDRYFRWLLFFRYVRILVDFTGLIMSCIVENNNARWPIVVGREIN